MSMGKDNSRQARPGVGMLLAKMVLVAVPAIAVYGFPLLVMTAGGEFVSYRQAEWLQRRIPTAVLYGPAYSDPQMQMKCVGVLNRHPGVVALGSSRVMQFRSAAFRPEARFYNAGGAVGRMSDLEVFLDRIPAGQEPRVILLGVDFWFLNGRWLKHTRTPTLEARVDDRLDRLELFKSSWRTVYRDSRAGKIPFGRAIGPHLSHIGLNAVVKGNGFRNDGSYCHGSVIRNAQDPRHEDYEFRDTLARIREGERRFERERSIRKKSVEDLDTFLARCQERGIHVVAFLPPLPHTIFQTLVESGDSYAYLWKQMATLEPVFRQHGYAVHDFMDLASLGAGDDEAIDGLHGSEKAYVRLLLRLIEKDPILAGMAADKSWLEKRLSAAMTPYAVFGDSEF